MLPDLSTLQKVPASSTYPIRRDGVHPVPELAQARAKEPVTRLTRLLGLDIWLVTGHAEAKAVLADSTSYSNDLRHLLGKRKRTGAESIGGLGMTDPPDHTRLRGLITPEFTKRRLTRLQAMIDEIVADSLDDLERLADSEPDANPVVDLVPHFGFAVPFRVICDLLGLPEEDRAAFRHGLGMARFDLTSGFAGSFGAATESRTFMIDAVARQRRNPGDGLIGAIIRSHGDQFDDVELGGLVDGVFLGGYETSASMLAMGAYVLMQRPDEWETMRTGTPAEIDAIVEELLRVVCPVQIAFPRFARQAHELGGHRIEKGAVVLVSLSGASRDPSVVPDPDDFSLRNPRTAHLAFGHGMHRCVGAELARMEIRAGLTGLARRFPDLALAPDAEPEFRQLSVVHSIDALPVVLR